MKKAIHIEKTTKNIARVLSVMPPDIDLNFNGQTYMIIEDYEEPNVSDSMDKAYPMYNKRDGKFFYYIEKFFYTPNQERVDVENMKSELNNLIRKTEMLKSEQEKAIAELTSMIAQMSMPPTM